MARAIGKRLPLGFLGAVSQASDFVITSRVSASEIGFGSPVVLNSDNTVSAIESALAVAQTGEPLNFMGIAVRTVLQQKHLLKDMSSYGAGQITDVMTRGVIIVVFKGMGTPAAGSAVHIRIAENAQFPMASIGDIEAAPDGANTVEMPNAVFRTGIVDGNLAEVTFYRYWTATQFKLQPLSTQFLSGS